jgi:hypothetical protein
MDIYYIYCEYLQPGFTITITITITALCIAISIIT